MKDEVKVGTVRIVLRIVLARAPLVQGLPDMDSCSPHTVTNANEYSTQAPALIFVSFVHMC